MKRQACQKTENFENDTFGAVIYLNFTYTGFPTGVPNMGGAPQNLIGQVFEENHKTPHPPTPLWETLI